jgi:alanyl-tRNA synthetase
MQKISTQDFRKKFLEYMQKSGHAIIPSSRLVPENDPTTLFTGSGMQPMLPYLLGQKHPLGSRIADSQKCFRSQDIEEVGDNRHTTFFEMLGNWSLGDFFKEEQIPMMWKFLTTEVGIPSDRLYFTCFKGKSYAESHVGMPGGMAEHMQRAQVIGFRHALLWGAGFAIVSSITATLLIREKKGEHIEADSSALAA